MVVEIVQKILTIGELGKPSVRHQRVGRLPESSQVFIIIPHSGPPRRRTVGIVQRHRVKIGIAVSTTIGGIVEVTQAQDITRVFQVATYEQKHTSPSIWADLGQPLEAFQNATPGVIRLCCVF